MVGTAQLANFAVFIKKVGYSVGLEALLSRSMDFAETYASVASLRESEWVELVHGKWKLKSAHVGDVFGALGIASIKRREVIPGPIGESLGIVRKLSSDQEFTEACRFLVALAIVNADADIFLNALKSSFDKDATA